MHPVLLHFIFPIYTYGTLVAIAFLAGITIALDRAGRQGISKDLVTNLLMVVLISSIAGARMLYVIEHWDYFRVQMLEIFMVHHGGLSYFGGLLGGLVGGIFYARKKKGNILALLDLFMPSLALGQAIGRLGCYFNGCCYGIVTEGRWGIRFPRGSSVFNDHLARGWVSPFDGYALPVLPMQLISSFLDLLLFCILIGIDNRKKSMGSTFFTYLIGYGLLRFCMEFLRSDSNPYTTLQWTLPQFIAAAAFLAGLVGLINIPPLCKGGTKGG